MSDLFETLVEIIIEFIDSTADYFSKNKKDEDY